MRLSDLTTGMKWKRSASAGKVFLLSLSSKTRNDPHIHDNDTIVQEFYTGHAKSHPCTKEPYLSTA